MSTVDWRTTMALDRNAATARIARQLRTAEKATDNALLAAAELMASLLQARVDDDSLVVHTGQKAIMRLVRAQQSLVDGGSDIFRVHDEMSHIGRELGIFDESNSTKASGLDQNDAFIKSA
jgi:hypothetical protein